MGFRLLSRTATWRVHSGWAKLARGKPEAKSKRVNQSWATNSRRGCRSIWLQSALNLASLCGSQTFSDRGRSKLTADESWFKSNCKQLKRQGVTRLTAQGSKSSATICRISMNPSSKVVWFGRSFVGISSACRPPRSPAKHRPSIFVEPVVHLSLTIYNEPNPYNPPLNLRPGTTKTIKVDLNSKDLPLPRLAPDPVQPDTVWVPAYTDFKLHDICDPNEAGEPLDQNQTPWTAKFRQGNRRFLTKWLWGAANEPPFFHHGLFTTLRRAVLAHSGEALQSRKQFEHLKEYDQDSLIEFLKTLQVLPPGTPYLVVDENFREKRWPPPSRLSLTIPTAPAAP